MSVEACMNMDRKPYYGSGNRSAASGRAGSAMPSSAPRRPSQGGYANAPRRNPPRPAQQPPRRPPIYGHRQPPRRRRRRDPLSVIMPFLLLAALIGCGIYVGSAWLTAKINQNTFCDHVYINEISLTDCTLAEAPQYLHDQLSQRLNTVYTLMLGEERFSFSPIDFNASINADALIDRAWNIGHVGNIFDRAKSIRALKQFPIHMNAPIHYDEALVDAYVDQLYNATYIAPENATVVVDVEKPYLTSESSRGQELDRETARAQIISLIENGNGDCELPMVVLEPALSTDAALRTMNVIVEYKTDVSARNYNSRYNVRKALSYFNGMEIKPGDTVDFNAIVGPRSEERGWKSAVEYVGNRTTEGFGGGVCQASTTLYGAMLLSEMTVIERHPHSMTVAYVDPSLDAAVSDTNGKNLIFRNDTDHSIFIYTEVTKEDACVTVYGNRPAYRYELYSNIISQDTVAVRTSYIDDVEGTHVYFVSDPPVLYKAGLAALSSDGYLIGYDWETNQEVTSTWLSHDEYESGTDIYWRGVHTLDEGLADFAADGGDLFDLNTNNNEGL